MPELGTIMPNMGTKVPKSGRKLPSGPGLADALFTRTQQAVLALLFGQPDRSFFKNEIIRKADALEDKLHNPTAEVVYDILAMRGGTRLYSRLIPLQMWAIDAEGPPTSGMSQVLQAQEKELADLETETRNFIEEEVGTLNAAAAKLGLSFVILK